MSDRCYHTATYHHSAKKHSCKYKADSRNHSLYSTGENKVVQNSISGFNLRVCEQNIANHHKNFCETVNSAAKNVIRYLRLKIDEQMGVKYLHTVRGVGYMIKA